MGGSGRKRLPRLMGESGIDGREDGHQSATGGGIGRRVALLSCEVGELERVGGTPERPSAQPDLWRRLTWSKWPWVRTMAEGATRK